MLSVLTTPGKHLIRQEQMLRNQLRGEDHEIITAPTWEDASVLAKGEYVCFIEPEAQLSEDYFHDLLDVFLEQPSFRKLAFVASSVSKPSWASTKRIYGYKIDRAGIQPNFIKTSIAPYSIQIGYLPGAIIRKSVLQSIANIERDPVMGSVRMSLSFWLNGLRCLIDPRAVYTSPFVYVDAPIVVQDSLPKDVEDLVDMFQRETI